MQHGFTAALSLKFLGILLISDEPKICTGSVAWQYQYGQMDIGLVVSTITPTLNQYELPVDHDRQIFQIFIIMGQQQMRLQKLTIFFNNLQSNILGKTLSQSFYWS